MTDEHQIQPRAVGRLRALQVSYSCGVIEIERAALPAHTVYRAFTPANLHHGPEQIEVGSSLLVVFNALRAAR